ncbi:MAG TPA: alpha/beta hydrolase [Candidatus Eisenbacteria bacterium]|nr:alpha/beta hydrolase [Candidatus Eisenbacteria bacterium]
MSRETVRRWSAESASARGVVLIVHGMGDYSGRHAGLAHALAAGGFDVVAGDLRGHGVASGARGHAERWDELLEDVESWWRVASSPEPVFVLGESMGGLVALDWALAHPERVGALVLAAPAFRPGFDPPAWKLALARVAQGVVPGLAQKTGIGGAMISRAREEADAFDQDPLTHQWMTARFFALYRAAAARLVASGPRVAWPTLVLGAGDDRVVSMPAIRAFAASNPGRIELREYAGAYHGLFHDLPDVRRAVIEDLLTFLQRNVT